ncbi:MAG: mechanosensitive ion channel family protein [Lachnospiraceae bacterium]
MFLTSTDTIDTLSNIFSNQSGFEKMLDDFFPKAVGFLIGVVVAIIIWIVGKKLIGFSVKVIERAFERAHIDEGISKFLISIARFSAYCILALIVISTVGIETSSIIGIISSLTLAVGLSFQGSLSNIAGGVLIIIFKPFTVGDYIISSGAEGTVEAIDILYTKIHTIDNKLITAPNGTLANSVVVNVGKEKLRRLDIPMGISYESDIKKAKDVLLSIVNESSYVMKDQDIRVIVTELAASSVNLEVRVWVKTEDYWNAKFYLLEKFKTVFDERGITIPFNQLDVHIKEQ